MNNQANMTEGRESEQTMGTNNPLLVTPWKSPGDQHVGKLMPTLTKTR